ncbi:guanylate kinase [Candidatus Babeliales bacterium]|nr:guanylate kinase [Candidatus Babeliales bacterium]
MTQHEKKPGRLFVISAPSGGGKTSLTNCVIEKLSSSISLEKVATYTSRLPRFNEKNGKDYYFVSRTDFMKKREDGFFLETTEYNGEFYGSPASIITDLKKGKSLILVADWDGAKKILSLIENPVLIWIVPPSLDALKKRIEARGTEKAEQIEARIKLAKVELMHERISKIFNYWVFNDNFERATQEIISIIQKELVQ